MKQIKKKIAKSKYLKIALLILLPFLMEFICNNHQIVFEKATIVRIGFVYGVYCIIAVFWILNKFSSKIKKILEYVLRYRYIIALIMFFVLVIGKFNFSSLDMWCAYLNESPEYESVIIGKERAIRSDEWLVQSPIFLAQTKSKDGPQIYNENYAGGNSNALITSAPAWDITNFCKPINWGFLLFGTEYGFSWYWVLKFIMLIMVSLELAMKLTKKDTLLSITGALLLGLAPAMMWWFSTAVVEAYIYGTAVIVLFSYYMNNLNWNVWKKILIAIGLLMFIPGFAFALYPAFQVPFAFFMAICMLNDFISNRKRLKKQDYIIMAVTIVGIIGMLIYFIKTAWPDIVTMMSTVYPGSRFVVGGNYNINLFISYFTNIFLPYTHQSVNQSELSTYIYPFTALIIMIIATFATGKKEEIRKKVKEDGLFIALIGLMIFLLIWLFIGFDEIIAKITFMYFSPVERTQVILGIVATLVMLMLLKKNSTEKNKIFTKMQSIIISIIVIVISYVLIQNSNNKEFFNLLKLEILLTMIFVMTYFYLRVNKKAFCYIMCIIAIVAGAIVNPISRGINVLYETEISNQINQIHEQDKEALWIGKYNWSGQYLLANGVKVLNGVHTYPNFDWLKTVDPEGIYEEVYNRYAHIIIILGNETKFELKTPDSYEVTLTYQNLKDLGVKYYFTAGKETEEIEDNFKLEMTYENPQKGQYIYKIK